MTLIEANEWTDYPNRVVTASTRTVDTGEKDIILEMTYSSQFDLLDLVSDISMRVHSIDENLYIDIIHIEGVL